MQITQFNVGDLARFRAVQRLAYGCCEAVQAQLTEGSTEKDAVRLMHRWLQEHGVTDLFHNPFAWFGDRAAFNGFWADHKFFPTGRKLAKGMAAILDIAPMVDGYAADVGFCFVFGDDTALDGMNRVLMQCRDHIVDAARARVSFKKIYQDVDAIIEKSGYVNRHKRYPHRVLGHRVARFEKSPLTRIRWMGFGLPQYVAMIGRQWISKLLPATVQSPLWNDRRESDHAPFVGLWAVEPHISLADQSLGTKWEEILVITEDDAYWLDNDVPHVRRAIRKGWSTKPSTPQLEALAAQSPDAIVC